MNFRTQFSKHFYYFLSNLLTEFGIAVYIILLVIEWYCFLEKKSNHDFYVSVATAEILNVSLFVPGKSYFIIFPVLFYIMCLFVRIFKYFVVFVLHLFHLFVPIKNLLKKITKIRICTCLTVHYSVHGEKQ